MSSDKKLIWLGWVIGVLLIVISRFPFISGAGAVLDGDEAILGLMAKHLSEGRSLELFFYGQNFGVTIIENINAALFFLVLGTSATSLKIATLSLWIVGWSFFLFGTRRLAGTSAALIAGLLLLGCSAWAIWPTLARGYHVGGFALLQFCYWQFAGLYKTGALPDTKPGSFALLGISTGLLFLTQKLWFIAFLPFLTVVLWQRKSRREVLVLSICAMALIALPQIIPGKPSQYWDPEYLREMNPILALTLLPERIWIFFSGAYSYATRMDSNLLSKITASGWCLLLVVAGVAMLKRVLSGPERMLCAAIITSGLLVMGATLFIGSPLFGYRYLLPLASLTCLAVSLSIGTQPKHRRTFDLSPSGITTLAITLILVAAGLLATVTGPNFRATASFEPTKLSPQQSIDSLIHDLEAQGIHHVYSLDPMLQWNIIFSSRESIIARWSDPNDRRPEYPLQVDQAFFQGDDIAIVGMAASLQSFTEFLYSQDMGATTIYTSGERYFWLPNPSRELLQATGFELNPVAINK